MRTSTARLTAAAAAACLTLGIAACSPDDETLTLPDESDQSANEPDEDAPEPEPDSEDDADDDEADGGSERGMDEGSGEYGDVDPDTEAAVEAFLVEFLDAYSVAWQTGDVAGWKPLFDANCRPCSESEARITRIYSEGGNIEGGEFADPAFEVRGEVPDQDDGRIEVLAQVTFTEYEIFGDEAKVEGDQAVVDKFEVADLGDGFKVVWWTRIQG